MKRKQEKRIELAHGGGGRLSRELISREIIPRLGSEPLEGLPDAATLPFGENTLIFTTDSFVVHPIFFPGGNIGDLAVHGTVNDIAAAGGEPLWLSVGLILEEGVSLEVLRRVLNAIRDTTNACGVKVVTGDTKVVAREQCDGLYVNTSGIGRKLPGFTLSPANITPGDHVLINGTIAEHGLAVMAARENIGITNGPESDTAPVHRLVKACADVAGAVRFMRDPTRGGIAAVLNEIVEDAPVGIEIDETALPFSEKGKFTAELLGLDPLQIACEGRLILVCAAEVSDRILEKWRAFPEGKGACRVGVVNAEAGRVTLCTVTGGRRLVEIPRGELLPRIC